MDPGADAWSALVGAALLALGVGFLVFRRRLGEHGARAQHRAWGKPCGPSEVRTQEILIVVMGVALIAQGVRLLIGASS